MINNSPFNIQPIASSDSMQVVQNQLVKKDVNEAYLKAVAASLKELNILPGELHVIIHQFNPEPFNDYLKFQISNTARIKIIKEIETGNLDITRLALLDNQAIHGSGRLQLITKLDLSDNQIINVSGVLELIRELPDLTEINLTNCKNITNDDGCVPFFTTCGTLKKLRKIVLVDTSLNLPERTRRGRKLIYESVCGLAAKGVCVELKMLDKIGLLGLAVTYTTDAHDDAAITSKSYTSGDILMLVDRASSNFQRYATSLTNLINRLKDVNMLFSKESVAGLFSLKMERMPHPNFTLLEFFAYQRCDIEIFKTLLNRKEDIEINRLNESRQTVLDICIETYYRYLEKSQQNGLEEAKKAQIKEQIASSRAVCDFLVSLGAKLSKDLPKTPVQYDLAAHFTRLSLQ